MKFEKIILDDTNGKEIRYFEPKSKLFASKKWWLANYKINPEEHLIEQ